MIAKINWIMDNTTGNLSAVLPDCRYFFINYCGPYGWVLSYSQGNESKIVDGFSFVKAAKSYAEGVV